MTRLAVPAAVLLFALPLAAAPVPKALKNRTPQVADTTWRGTNTATDGGLDIAGDYEYTFHAGGQFSCTHKGQPYSTGTWKQDGDTVEWEFNNRYAVYTVKFAGTRFEGTGANQVGKSWAVTLSPVEK